MVYTQQDLVSVSDMLNNQPMAAPVGIVTTSAMVEPCNIVNISYSGSQPLTSLFNVVVTSAIVSGSIIQVVSGGEYYHDLEHNTKTEKSFNNAGELKMPSCPPKSTHYVNKHEMIAEIRKYHETKIVSEELGGMLLKIATRFCNRPCFTTNNYSNIHINDMIGEAVSRMIQKIDRFDINRPGRLEPFAYFCQIGYNQIRVHLNREKKQREIKRHSQEILWDQFCHDEGIVNEHVNSDSN